MDNALSNPCAAFAGTSLLAAGPLLDVALTVKAYAEGGGTAAVLVFENTTGGVIDLDLRGTAADVVSRLLARGKAKPGNAPSSPSGPGRPRLGVVAREVTLLPRHWEWLSAQPGGASAAVRRLVEEARKGDGAETASRTAREAAYRFMSAIGGDLPRFEEASRALFAGDRPAMEGHLAGWPPDVRAHVLVLAGFAAPAN